MARYRIPVSLSATDEQTFVVHPGEAALDLVMVSLSGNSDYYTGSSRDFTGAVYWTLGLLKEGVAYETARSLVRLGERGTARFDIGAEAKPSDGMVLLLRSKEGTGPTAAGLPTGVTANFTFYFVTETVE